MSTVEAATTGAGTFSSFVLATVQLTVTTNVQDDGADVWLGFFHTDVDGLVDDANQVISGTVAFGAGTVNAQPGPFCLDADSDGFGDATICMSGFQPGFVADATDCNDADPDIRPNQTTFFEAPHAGGTFDYDCDGVETLSDTRFGACGLVVHTCVGGPGWTSPTPPGCGEAGTKLLYCTGTSPPGCSSASESAIQGCR